MGSSNQIADSTDWIPTSLPTFEPLEAALRCEVCKEFYENPVVTSCLHTFCSLCIRRGIANDGKCPSCRASCQADKLIPNNAVREIVDRFKAARPQALELARENKEELGNNGAAKKRKFDETDMEDGDNVRQTRSRRTRSSQQRNDGASYEPIEVSDDEYQGEEDIMMPGMVHCPMCNETMKEAAVWVHIDKSCPGERKATGDRNTRSRNKDVFPNSVQIRPKDNSPAPARLPGINYPSFKEGALRKKLSELGIPSWGQKTLLIKRHTEWLNIYNANCDAGENRKAKHELLKELDTWEKTQGGRANEKDSIFMRKDFDGSGHATLHKSQFHDLIAQAKKQRSIRKETNDEIQDEKMEGVQTTEPLLDPHSEPQPASHPKPNTNGQPDAQKPIDPARPYEGNETALASIREKVKATKLTDPGPSSLSQEAASVSKESNSSPTENKPTALQDSTGIRNPFGSPTRTLPMFSLSEQPVVDVDHAFNLE